MSVVAMQHSVALDHCPRWNHALQKAIIAATISTYRLAMGATGRDYPHSGPPHMSREPAQTGDIGWKNKSQG